MFRLPSVKWTYRNKHPKLWAVRDAYFFLWLSMYDKAAKTTSNNVKTSITLMGITLLCKTRGHPSENRILLSFQLYNPIIAWTQVKVNFIWEIIYIRITHIKNSYGIHNSVQYIKINIHSRVFPACQNIFFRNICNNLLAKMSITLWKNWVEQVDKNDRLVSIQWVFSCII